jgi:peptidoglycan/xylan/chitin deacetylase (PgdA/CDA1 family)
MTVKSPWPQYQWPAGIESAFCFSIDVDAEMPMLWSQRDSGTQRLGTLELRRFGPRTGLWRILDLLNRFEVKASFFVPAGVAEMHPEILPALVEGGHEIGLHGYFHELVSESSQEEFEAALDASLALFMAQAGITPAGFRSPAWEMTPAMLATLKARGLYDSSLMGFDHPYTIDGVTEVPVQWITDDAIYFKFQGGGSDKWAPSAPGPVLEGWIDEWQLVHRYGGLFMLTIHDWISGRAQKIAMLERLLAAVQSEPKVWVTTVGAIAAHHENSPNREGYAVASDLPQPVGPRRFLK